MENSLQTRNQLLKCQLCRHQCAVCCVCLLSQCPWLRLPGHLTLVSDCKNSVNSSRLSVDDLGAATGMVCTLGHPSCCLLDCFFVAVFKLLVLLDKGHFLAATGCVAAGTLFPLLLMSCINCMYVPNTQCALSIECPIHNCCYALSNNNILWSHLVVHNV